eukprot:CAMPEP_0195039326 /NCGR_PEP_ID=MMETSP0326_2-20130528/79462_1 /TAXON_ID=2866 ORGANISM="Crypthecodinium cohnii, Strain Seligo" /NCGR_SAMPLE_ID=MMETSP0326_2 /ASSEMBLY_ACC=CAM_ASM_000348 /LENGTH=43 /DNA_ID= /DNA_START= /DNA_END= /DNA_ORIENTATION=
MKSQAALGGELHDEHLGVLGLSEEVVAGHGLLDRFQGQIAALS